MSDDTFIDLDDDFDPGNERGGVSLVDAEARFADLVVEVIWGGTITPEGRQRLENARSVYGLDPERARQIEEAIIAAQKVEIVEEPTEPGDESWVAPIARSEDPRIEALQRRIEVVEDENDQLLFENRSLRDLVEQLENLVGQLQSALEETLDELASTSDDDAPSEEPSTAGEPAASRIRGTQPTPPLAAPSLAGPPELPPDAPPEPPPSRAMPAARGELPTLLGIGHDLMVPPVPRPEPSHVAVPAMRSRLRSHEAIEEVIAPVFDAAPDGVIKRRRHNPAHLHADLEKSPRDVELLRELLASLGRAADHDRRFRIAQVLVFLGEARDEERALYEKHAEGGLARPRRALEDEEWTELLFHPEEDRLTGRILAAIAPAVMLGQMGAIRASLAPEVVDPSREVDPHGSTLQAVRCLNWAAAILGLDTPPVYVCPDHPGTIDVVLNPRPVTRLGKLALSGRRSRELAFSAGRHLSWFRKEHLLGRPRGSVRRLEDMFLAALLMGNPGLPITGEVKKRVAPIAAAIFPLLDASAVEGLKREFGRFVAEGGRTKLGRWLRGAERTGDRAGMLLTNDLWAAEHMLKLEEPERATTAIDELIGFVTSETYGTLRRRIGIALPSND